MSEDIHIGSLEFERLEQDLYALIEEEQATLLRSLALPVGYGKSQALAEHSNAVAAASATQQKRKRFLLADTYLTKLLISALMRFRCRTLMYDLRMADRYRARSAGSLR
jgi:hypothetical protein